MVKGATLTKVTQFNLPFCLMFDTLFYVVLHFNLLFHSPCSYSQHTESLCLVATPVGCVYTGSDLTPSSTRQRRRVPPSITMMSNAVHKPHAKMQIGHELHAIKVPWLNVMYLRSALAIVSLPCSPTIPESFTSRPVPTPASSQLRSITTTASRRPTMAVVHPRRSSPLAPSSWTPSFVIPWPPWRRTHSQLTWPAIPPRSEGSLFAPPTILALSSIAPPLHCAALT